MSTSFDKILLGKLKVQAPFCGAAENIWLSKHSWDCGWYWGMGYLGNKNLHFHFKQFLEDSTTASELFEVTNITDSEWWVIRDLFVQAYALKAAAEVYIHGGHQTERKGVTDVLQNAAKAMALNDDLERILDLVWDYTCKAVNKQTP